MKLNIGSFRICVMLEQVSGSFDRLYTLNGRRLAILLCFAATVYVGTTAHTIKDLCSESSQLGVVRVFLRTQISILLTQYMC